MKFTRFLSSLFCLIFVFTGPLAGQPQNQMKQRNLLSGKYSPDNVRNSLLKKEEYHPFPKADEREVWDSVPENIKKNYMTKGERALSSLWPSITVSDYLDYFRTGSREKFSSPYNERRQKLMDLVLAECLENKGRFIEQIADGIWLICEETSWVPPFHIVYQKAGAGLPDINDGYVDLMCAETGNLLAWTYYLLGGRLDKISPFIKSRIVSEIKKRITDLCLKRDDFWWMWTPGKEDSSHTINNWVPWICSNWLAAVLLIEEKDEIRSESVYKIMQTLDRFINSYPDDGGCDEGPSYWEHAAGSLFESLELLAGATHNKIDIFDNSLIKEMGRYLYRAYISGDYYINTGDAAARIKINPDLVLRYGLKIKDEYLAGLGAFSAVKQGTYMSGISGSMTRQLSYLFSLSTTMKQEPKEPLLSEVWLADTKIMAARAKENSKEGFYIAAVGSNNGKSHNHNDTGNFILYADGEPVIIDAGLGTYTAKTFSSERYTLWTMQSGYHNLPAVNGLMQRDGKEYAAKNHIFSSGRDSVLFSLDIAGAYPKEAGLSKWVRTIKLSRRMETVEVAEDYSSGASLNELSLSFMTPCSIEATNGHSLTLYYNKDGHVKNGTNVILSYDPGKMSPEIQKIVLDDKRLSNIWGNELKRIVFHVKEPASGGSLKIIFSQSGK